MMLPDHEYRGRHRIHMGDIIPFAKDGLDRPRKRREAMGEIVIFPGIRVEYHDGTPSPPTSHPPRRAKRRRAKDALSA